MQSVKNLQINFLSELKLGDKIKLFKNDSVKNKYYLEGTKEKTKIFQMIFEYEYELF